VKTLRKHQYPHTLTERLYSFFLAPLLLIGLLFLCIKIFNLPFVKLPGISFYDIGLASVFTLGRLLSAYILAIVVAIPLAILATHSSVAEKILLPVFDILESVPILAFFPVLIFLFFKIGALNVAAIFILFLSMLWNIVFTLVGGIKIIPQDIISASKVFKINGFQYLRNILLPAIFPEIVTGSILAMAQGWNLIIVAEVMHTYIPHGSASQDLFGLGSILVNSAASGQNSIFLITLLAMILIIALFNFFIWQKLLHYAQRFKFE
jgi:NitT/TauT family transport system permease protein